MGLVSGMVFRCTIAFLERSRWRFDVRSFVLFVGVFVLVLCLHHVCGFLVYGFGSPSGSFVGECYLLVLGMSVVIVDLFAMCFPSKLWPYYLGRQQPVNQRE